MCLTLITLLLRTKLEKRRFSFAHFTNKLQIIGQGINKITITLQDYLIWKGGAENFANWLFYIPFHYDYYRDQKLFAKLQTILMFRKCPQACSFL